VFSLLFVCSCLLLFNDLFHIWQTKVSLLLWLSRQNIKNTKMSKSVTQKIEKPQNVFIDNLKMHELVFSLISFVLVSSHIPLVWFVCNKTGNRKKDKKVRRLFSVARLNRHAIGTMCKASFLQWRPFSMLSMLAQNCPLT
jgi:hypothetical protein